MKPLRYLFASLCVLFFAHLALAQATVPGAVSGTPDIGGRIIAVAAVVAAILQGLKKFIPVINGPFAVVLSVVLAAAAAYASADPAHVLDIGFFATTLVGALGANGVYHLAKVAGGTPPAAK